MQGIRRHIGSRFVLIMAGAALISVVGHSQQLREYIYLGNNVIAIDSGTPAVVSATVGNPLDVDKLNIPVGLVFSGPSPSVINILINSDLNGTSACYLAIVPASNVAFLVVDSGPPDLLPAVPFNSTQSATNSQCTVTGTGIGYTSSSTGGSLNVTIQFNSNFKGKKVMYAAVRTTIGGNSGWQSVGAIRVGKFGMDDPTSMDFDGRVKNPAGSQNMTVSSSTDNTISAELWNPLYKWTGPETRIANLLINSAIDGRSACYMAVIFVSPPMLVLVNDAGKAEGPFAGAMTVNAASTPIANSQCQINSATRVLSPDDKLLTLTLGLRYTPLFRGYRVFFPAIRIDPITSLWFAGGTVQIN